MCIAFDNHIDFLLAFISSILGLSVPIMLQVIERIDDKYYSTRLAERLKREPVIRWCGIFLLTSLLTCIYAVFVKAPSPWDCWVLNNSAYLLAIISCIVLIVLFLCSCIIILAYYNPEKLQRRIIRSIEKSESQKQRIEHLKDLVDLSKTVLDMSEREPAMRIYDVLNKEIIKVIEASDDNGMVIPQHLAYGITSINENLCLMERRPFSINNGNQLLKMLIADPTKLSDETYSLLWRNLILQLHYNADEWVYEYWSAAVQVYDFDLPKIYAGTYGMDCTEEYSQDKAEMRLSQRQRFLEFHIVLCSYIMHKKKYDLLSKLLWYTRVYPPEYPLVPSSLTEIISIFTQMDDSPRMGFPVESYYPFLGEKGIVDGEIQGAVKLYLSLLYLRVFSAIGRVVDTSITLPDTLGRLKSFDSYLQYLEWGINKLIEDPEIRSLFKIDKEKASKIIEEHRSEIKSAINRVRVAGRLDEVMIKENIEELRDLVSQKLSVYNGIFEIEPTLVPDVAYWINGSVSYPYPNAALMSDSDMSYVGMAESVGGSTIGKFQYYFASIIYQNAMGQVYSIKNQELFDAIDKLAIDDKFAIISFNVYWDYYLGQKQSGLMKEKGRLMYNGIRIISLPSGGFPLMDQSIYVLRKKDFPKITFIELNQEQIYRYKLNRLDERFQLFSSIIQLSKNPDVKEIVQRDLPNENLEEKSLFSSFLTAKVEWSKRIPIIGIKLMYDLRNNGTADDLSVLSAFCLLTDNNLKKNAMHAEDIAIYQLGKELGVQLIRKSDKKNGGVDAEGEKDGKKIYLEVKYTNTSLLKNIETIEYAYNKFINGKEPFDFYIAIISDLPRSKAEKERFASTIQEHYPAVEVRFYSFYTA